MVQVLPGGTITSYYGRGPCYYGSGRCPAIVYNKNHQDSRINREWKKVLELDVGIGPQSRSTTISTVEYSVFEEVVVLKTRGDSRDRGPRGLIYGYIM